MKTMKNLTAILFSSLMLMMATTSNAQYMGFGIEWYISGNNGTYQMTNYNAIPVAYENMIFTQIGKIVDIDTISMVGYDPNQTQSIITEPTDWWVNGKFIFKTMNGSVNVNLSDFVDGYYITTIENVFAVIFMYDSYVEICAPFDTRVFQCEVRDADLVSGSVVTQLNNTITQLNDTIIQLNDTITQLNVIITQQAGSITTLQQHNAQLEEQNAEYEAEIEENLRIIGLFDSIMIVEYNRGYDAGYAAGLIACEESSISTTPDPLDINIYPNPVSTNGRLYIETEGFSHVEIYTTTGVLMITEFNQEFYINQLTQGLYIVKVYDNQGKVNSRKIQVK